MPDSNKFKGRGTRKSTPRPTAGRTPAATPEAIDATLDRLERQIKVAAKKPKHDYATATRLWLRMDELAGAYEASVLCLAPDAPPDEYEPPDEAAEGE